jgi:N utilization substance protein B
MAEGPKAQMPARRKARKRALDVLFEADLRNLPPAQVLTGYVERLARPLPAHLPYAETLVHGVAAHQDRIDELIASYAEGWTIDRMPAVDRNVLRLGVFEILYVDEVPDAVAVSEAMALVRDLSTDESPSFVNGILGNIVRDKAVLSA